MSASTPDDRRNCARFRLAALALVAALALATRALAPDPGSRRASLLWIALGLGYGHQLGAWSFAKRKPRTAVARAARGLTLVNAGLAFALALATPAAPALMVALAALAAWHVIENDLAGSRSSPGRLRLPPLPRRAVAHLSTAFATAVALGVVFAAPRLAPVLVSAGVPPGWAVWTPEEGIAVLLLYHTVLWWGVSLAVLARSPRGGSRVAGVVAAHLIPLAVLPAVSHLAPVVYGWLVSPAVYLFLSGWHAVHTSVERGLEPGDEIAEIPARFSGIALPP